MKYFIIFAGPNGSGKSSLRSSFEKNPPAYFEFLSSLEGVRNINADFFARTDPQVSIMPDGDEKDKAAWELTEAARHQSLVKGENIIWETVFSHESRIAEINEARRLGYYVPVIYVTTQNPEINTERVANRVKNGGHGVPPEKIKSRYKKSTNLLPDIVLTADEVLVYDNSSSHPVLLFFKVNDTKIPTLFTRNRKPGYYLLPMNDIGKKRYEWIYRHLIQPLKERGCVINQL